MLSRDDAIEVGRVILNAPLCRGWWDGGLGIPGYLADICFTELESWTPAPILSKAFLVSHLAQITNRAPGSAMFADAKSSKGGPKFSASLFRDERHSIAEAAVIADAPVTGQNRWP